MDPVALCTFPHALLSKFFLINFIRASTPFKVCWLFVNFESSIVNLHPKSILNVDLHSPSVTLLGFMIFDFFVNMVKYTYSLIRTIMRGTRILRRKIKTNLFYLAAGIYIGIAIVSFIPWIEIGVKITAYTSIIALLITIYDSSKVALALAAAEGNPRKEKVRYVFMLAMKILLVISPFALLYWINYEDDEAVIARISNYVTFAALGVVFFTRGMELKSQSNDRSK